MKKAAILTITNSGLNFGNRLQNYALQKVIEEYGVTVETIRSAKSAAGLRLISAIRFRIKKIVKNDRRRRCFNEFDKKYIKYAKQIRYEKINERKFADLYDGFVAGSDQVWNPNFHFNSDFEFAAFAPEEKRFSYAASIGVSHIEDNQKFDFVRNIKGMRTISVRESDSVELVQRLTGREAKQHVDPTMLLDSQEYAEMEERPPQGIPDRYLLMYFLGEVPALYRKKIEELAGQLGLETVELSETKGTKYYNIGPQHFLYVIHHADYICTDSFHGSVFSLLFQKQFSIFVRMDKDVPMNSRVDTLVKKFKITDRLEAGMDIDEAMKPIDYKTVNKILSSERAKARDYLYKISNL